jgi:iron complex transport system substrate-binding protein
MTDRHTLLAGLCATLVAPVPAHATTTITDDAAPASILLYTFAPELMPGWTRTPKPAQCAFFGACACARPEIGRLTGCGNTTNLEVLLDPKPDARYSGQRHVTAQPPHTVGFTEPCLP